MTPRPHAEEPVEGLGVGLRSPAIWIGCLAGLVVSTLLAGQLFPADPITTPVLARDHSGLIERTARFGPVLAAAEPADLEALRARVDAFEPGPQDADLLLFAEWWARFDPEAAHQWAIAIEDETDLPVRMGVLRAWARADPMKALSISAARFFAKNPGLFHQGGVWQDPGTQAALIGWDESLVPGLEEWVFETEDRQERQGLMELLARRRAVTMSPQQAWEWSAGLPGDLARDMLPRVASAIADRSPEEAARLAMAELESGSGFVGLPRRVATRWAKRDPRAALEWLAQTPAGHDRQDAVVESARTWLSTDKPSFMAYMGSRVDEFPEWLEAGFGLYARALMRDQRPEEGLRVAAKIEQLDLRNYTITLILRQWLDADPSAAEAWIEEAGVPEPIRRRAGFRPR